VYNTAPGIKFQLGILSNIHARVGDLAKEHDCYIG